MTVPSTTRRAGPYLGNGVTTSFPFTFKVFAKSDIALTLTSPTGVSTVLVLDSTYSVTLNVDQDTTPGGSITYPLSGSPMPTGYTLVGVGAIPYDQTTSFPAGGPYRAETTEDTFDRTEFQIQQLAEGLGRAVSVPPAAAGIDSQLPVPEANKLLGWNPTADALTNIDPQALATVVAYGTANSDVFTGDGTTTVFTLSDDPGNLNNLDVAIGGVTQLPTIDYTWSAGTTFTTTSPVPNGVKMLVRYMQGLPQSGAALPNQTGNAGRVLRTNGTDPSWDELLASLSSFTLDLATPANARASNLFERGRNIVFATDIGVADPIDPSFTLDSTAGLNQALAETRGNYGARPHAGKLLVIPPGRYKVSGQLTLGTNQHVWFMPGVTIDASATTTLGVTDVLFAASNQDSVHLYGNGAKIVGNRDALTAAGETLEGGQFGFFFYGTVNFSIRNFRIYDFWTEGIMVDGDNTGSGPCENGLIEECFVNNCRRNGLAIVSAKGVRVVGGQYSNNSGNPAGPNAGIDVEPNANCFIEAVQLIGVRTFNNPGGGIWFAPGPLSTAGSASDMYQVEVLGGHSYNDGTADVANAAALQFIVGNGGGIAKKLRGGVTVRDFVVESPLGRGVSFYNWDSEYLPRALLDNVTVYDPNAGGSGAANANKAGFVVYADSTQTSSSSLGNIVLRNCIAEDRRGSPQMTWGFLLAADGAKKVRNVAVHDCYASNFTASDKSHVSTQAAAGLNGNLLDCTVVYTIPAVQNETGSRNISASGGMRLRSTVNALEFTLPVYLSSVGMAYEVQCGTGVTAAVVKIDAVNSPGDRISLNGAALATSISVPPGSAVRLRCNSTSDAVFSATYTQ